MRVAVLGAGYAGLALARKLEAALPSEVDLVVVDEDATHLVQHELHRVVRWPGLADDISLPLADVLEDAAVREARVTDVDPEAGVATLETAPDDDGDGTGTGGGDGAATTGTLEYDFAAVCLGASTNYYDLPGVEAHATPLKRLADAERIRADFLDALESGSPDDPARVVVGGAGLSGIQVAGELAALAREEGSDWVTDDEVILTEGAGAADENGAETEAATESADDHDAEAGDGEAVDRKRPVEVVLLEMEDSVAPRFPANFQRAVRDQLETRGVRVRTGAAVATADAEAVELESGERLAYDQFIWTGGIRGPAALEDERPPVRNTLRLGDGTFVLGDAGKVVDTDGEAVPASAQAAVRQARVAAENIRKLVAHEREGGEGFEPRLSGYRFDSPGWLVSVGDGAVAQVGPTVLTGYAAKALKTTVGAGYLSSVGAVENAVDLVREEVGWPGRDDDGGDEEDDADRDVREDDPGPIEIDLTDDGDEG